MDEISWSKFFATFIGAFLGTFAGTFAYKFFRDKGSNQRRNLN